MAGKLVATKVLTVRVSEELVQQIEDAIDSGIYPNKNAALVGIIELVLKFLCVDQSDPDAMKELREYVRAAAACASATELANEAIEVLADLIVSNDIRRLADVLMVIEQSPSASFQQILNQSSVVMAARKYVTDRHNLSRTS